jgi:hypothetical protein
LAAPVTKATFPFNLRLLESEAGMVKKKGSTLDSLERQTILVRRQGVANVLRRIGVDAEAC